MFLGYLFFIVFSFSILIYVFSFFKFLFQLAESILDYAHELRPIPYEPEATMIDYLFFFLVLFTLSISNFSSSNLLLTFSIKSLSVAISLIDDAWGIIK